MYTSGQFSGMFRVSKKLLRHYHDIELLIPSEVDSSNGYFYYDQCALEKMKQIIYLRLLRMPLSDIKYLLGNSGDIWVTKNLYSVTFN